MQGVCEISTPKKQIRWSLNEFLFRNEKNISTERRKFFTWRQKTHSQKGDKTDLIEVVLLTKQTEWKTSGHDGCSVALQTHVK